MGEREIFSDEELRELYGPPSARAVAKQQPALNEDSRAFIAHAPFLVMGTSGADGRCDVSPKGDAPGFVQVLDDHTLLIPDRQGNNRLDGLGNIVQNAHVGLLFFIPAARTRCASTAARRSSVTRRCSTACGWTASTRALRSWSRSRKSSCTARGRSSAPASGSPSGGPRPRPSARCSA